MDHRGRFMVYLAGPITGCSYAGCTDWRAYADGLFKTGIKGVSPMRAKDYLSQEMSIGHAYEGTILSCARGIMTRDRMDVMRADLVLVNLLGATAVSMGTVMEMAWADLLRKPIVVAMEPKGNPHEHPMVTEAIGFRCASLEEACHTVNAILLPG